MQKKKKLAKIPLSQLTNTVAAANVVFTSSKRCPPIIKKYTIDFMFKLPKIMFTKSLGQL